MIYQELSKGDFRDAFARCDRKDNFSYEGLGVLYDYLEGLGEDYELDVIGLCCEYAEEEIEEVLKDYRLGSIEELEENTVVLWRNESRVLYEQF